jgi:microcystin-dependent protein
VATFYMGQIKMFGFNFPPKGWALCNGQTLPINQNAALFSILGTTYGGNGVSTFQLPNLQSRVPVHFSSQYALGTTTGTETVVLNATEMPSHTHSLNGANSAGTASRPVGHSLANVTNAYNHYGPAGGGAVTPLQPTSISTVGGAAHPNIQPYLAVNFSICLSGIFPSRN